MVYVDDIIVVMKDAQAFFDELQGPNVGFTMKGFGNLLIILMLISFMMMLMMALFVLEHKPVPNIYVPHLNLSMGATQPCFLSA